MALYDPANSRWQTVGGKVAGAMVTVNAVHLGFWLDALRPARDKLTAPLATIFRDRERPQTERSLAFNILEDYASDQPNVLVQLADGLGGRPFRRSVQEAGRLTKRLSYLSWKKRWSNHYPRPPKSRTTF